SRGWSMRRLTIVLLVVAAGCLALASPLAAQSPDANLNREVTGPLSRTESFFPGGSFLRQVFDATHQPGAPRPRVPPHDLCVRFTGTNVFPVDGTFQLTTRTGATLTGTVAGTATVPTMGEVVALDFTLTVTGGTRQFTSANGSIALDGIWRSTIPPANAISG